MKKILLVEDDPFLIDIYSSRLSQENLNVKVAKDGEESLKMLEKEDFDILILDIVLPKMSGWEVLEKLPKNKKEKMKILVFSNVEDEEDIKRAKELGVKEYLLKYNYTPSEVVNIIKNLLK